MSKGAEAYRIKRDSERSWREVNEIIGLRSAGAAMRAAKDHALQESLPWPLSDEQKHQPSQAEPGSTGELAYNMRFDTGLSFAEIADRIGAASSSSAYTLAKKYAWRNSLKWPLPLKARVKAAAVKGKLGPEAYVLRKEHRTWAEVGRQLGIDSSEAQAVARFHAETEGLEWPLKRVAGGRCYSLRRDGLAWKDIAEKSGYVHPQHANAAARKWAKHHGLPWPVEVGK